MGKPFLGISAPWRLVFRDVAQSGSAPEWGSGGRGFKSRRPDWFKESALQRVPLWGCSSLCDPPYGHHAVRCRSVPRRQSAPDGGAPQSGRAARAGRSAHVDGAAAAREGRVTGRAAREPGLRAGRRGGRRSHEGICLRPTVPEELTRCLLEPPRPFLGLEVVERRPYGGRADPLVAAVHIFEAAAPHHPVFARAYPVRRTYSRTSQCSFPPHRG